MHMPPGTWRHNPHTVIIRQHTKNKKLTHTRPPAIRFNNHPARRNAQACIPPTPSPPRLSLSFVRSFDYSFFLPSFPKASQRCKLLRTSGSFPRERAPVPRPLMLPTAPRRCRWWCVAITMRRERWSSSCGGGNPQTLARATIESRLPLQPPSHLPRASASRQSPRHRPTTLAEALSPSCLWRALAAGDGGGGRGRVGISDASACLRGSKESHVSVC